MQHAETRDRRLPWPIAVAMAFILASTAILVTVQVASAAISTCYVYTWIPWQSGSWIYGGGTIDCDSPDPVSDEIRSWLYEWYAWPLERDQDWVYQATFSPLSVATEYNCAGHGLDEWYTKSRGRDGNGNYSYYYQSLNYQFNCP